MLQPKDNTENELKVLQHVYSVTVDLTDNVPLKSLIGFAWTGYLAKLKDGWIGVLEGIFCACPKGNSK